MSKRKATPKVLSSYATSASIASPIGLIIGSGSNKWRIGEFIGQGACASVHELQPMVASEAANSNSTSNSGSSSEWVIKLAGVPISISSSSNGKKRKKTDKERQADTVRLETTLLSNKLGSLMGQFIPTIPLYGDKNAPPAHGEITTTGTLFTYIVMERMASPLASWASVLLNDNKSTAALAQQMLECIRQLHLLQLVYVDVKLDNFMLTVAPPNSSSTRKTTITTNPAPFLRIIDFGLVETLQDAMTGKHREDVIKGSPSAGTPIYASCNLMEGHTPSRRDDLEALGYVIVDFLLLASHQQLPWAHASSDQDILLSKKKATFYSLLSTSNAKVLQEYMKVVQQLQYYDKPDYEQLRNLLGRLVAGFETTTSSVTTTSTATRSSTTKRSKKTIVVVDDSSTKPPATKLSKAKKEYKTNTQQSHDDDDVMDWEPISSGEEAKENSAPPAKNSLTACFQLNFTKGPLAGSCLDAYDGTTIVMGNDPKKTATKKSVVVAVVPDDEISQQELKLAIQSTKWKAYSIRVTNVGGSSTTKVKNKPLAKGTSIQCFAGDHIQFGSTTLVIEKV